jgi:SAM-dependent methyltransferase
MFSRSAHLYDLLYAGKDYGREARRIHELIGEHKRSPGRTLLDVACGTGRHLAHLRRHYTAEGLDVDADLLAIARRRNPRLVLHRADMVEFALEKRFDAVVCLFSSIGYARTPDRLRRAVRTMLGHVAPGGVLIVEAWFTPEVYRTGTVHALFGDTPDLKVARMNVSAIEDRIAILDFHYLVATADRIEHFTERHELGLFTHDEYLQAFRASGAEAVHDPEGLTGRGLYIAVQPPELEG